MFALIATGLFIAVVCALAATGELPPAVIALYASSSATTFVLYWLDKSAALSGARRTPEDVLLVVGLICGWPGALLAQQLLRHKSLKTSFQLMFWMTVVLNCAGLGWFWSVHS